jgi:DNA-binding protein Alba
MDASTFPSDADNIIYVGDKPFLNYVSGIVIQFTMHDEREVNIKARGNHIGRAVDVAEAAVKRFLKGTIEVEDVAIDSERARSKEGEEVHVSHITIRLVRSTAKQPLKHPLKQSRTGETLS